MPDKGELVEALVPAGIFEDDGNIMYGANKIGPGQLNSPLLRVHIPKEGGILSYRQGEKYPFKGWPLKEAVAANDTVKRAVINLLKFITSSPMRYIVLLFFLLPGFLKRKVIKNAVVLFADYTDRVYTTRGVYWKPQFYCDAVREIWRVGMLMTGDDEVMKKYGKEQLTKEEEYVVHKKFLVKALCSMLEFDDAYRYFTQDLMSLVSVEAILDNPSREISRILKIAQNKGAGTSGKFKVLARVLPLAFYIKEVRETVIDFFSKVVIQRLYLDKADLYRCLLWGGWKFEGMPQDDKGRVSLRMTLDAEWNLNNKLKLSKK